mmetsp:Transcript_8568/g.12491  ORF Transcript_8568/g.12491 Transcript_8568/m.12491 type:complete len:233 (+) Transcript_8568:195-893(+)
MRQTHKPLQDASSKANSEEVDAKEPQKPIEDTKVKEIDSWVPYNECKIQGRRYRSFKKDDPTHGKFAMYGFPNDGHYFINYTNFKQFPTCELTYEALSLHGNKWNYVKCNSLSREKFSVHIAVALLWGAENNSGVVIQNGHTPYSQGLVTDHVIEGNKHNYHIDNLQLITNAQNANKFHNAKKAINAIREFPKSGTWMGPTPISTETRDVDFSFVTPYFDKRNGGYFVQHMI